MSAKHSTTQLLGYGVELQIKTSEYKAQDDRQLQAENESGEDLTDETAETKSKDIDGFYFNTLNNLHQEDKENLVEFKQFLLDQASIHLSILLLFRL